MNQSRAYEVIQWVLWGLLVISLPITSFPLVTRIAGGTMVGPAALLPLLALVLVWWIPYILRRGILPGQSLPLLAFTAIALLSSLVSLFLYLPPFQGSLVWRQLMEGLGTLMIGIMFFLVSASWPVTDLRIGSFTGILSKKQSKG